VQDDGKQDGPDQAGAGDVHDLDPGDQADEQHAQSQEECTGRRFFPCLAGYIEKSFCQNRTRQQSDDNRDADESYDDLAARDHDRDVS
jgi:hypothetical protein